MSVSWRKRKIRLDDLLKEDGGEDAKGLALDRILHGQSVIGKTGKLNYILITRDLTESVARTSQIDELKFGDKDLNVVGTLEYGQYGVVSYSAMKLR